RYSAIPVAGDEVASHFDIIELGIAITVDHPAGNAGHIVGRRQDVVSLKRAGDDLLERNHLLVEPALHRIPVEVRGRKRPEELSRYASLSTTRTVDSPGLDFTISTAITFTSTAAPSPDSRPCSCMLSTKSMMSPVPARVFMAS